MHGLVVPSDFFLEGRDGKDRRWWLVVSLCGGVSSSDQGVELTEKWIAPCIWWDEVHSPEVNPLTAAPCSATPKNLCTKINYNRMSNDSNKKRNPAAFICLSADLLQLERTRSHQQCHVVWNGMLVVTSSLGLTDDRLSWPRTFSALIWKGSYPANAFQTLHNLKTWALVKSWKSRSWIINQKIEASLKDLYVSQTGFQSSAQPLRCLECNK